MKRELKTWGKIFGKGLAILAGTLLLVGFAASATGGLTGLIDVLAR